MFSFVNKNEYKEYKLGDICHIYTGGEPSKDSIKSKIPLGEYKYPIYSNGLNENAVWGFSKTYKIDQKAITFSSIGTIGSPVIREPFFTPIIRLKVIIPKNKDAFSIKYIKYYLESIQNFQKNQSSIPNINSEMIKNIVVKIPTIEIQMKIVSILDKFSKYVEDMKEGLPSEIELRKKQYEYYRDLLLNVNKYSVLIREREREINK